MTPRLAISPPLLLALLAALAATPTAPAQEASDDRAEQAIAEFQRYARRDNEHVRKAAVDDLGMVDHLDVTRVLVDQLQDPSDAVRDAVIVALSKQRNDAGQTELRKLAWRSRDTEVQLAILEAWTLHPVEKAWPILPELAGDRDWRIREKVVELAAKYPNTENRVLSILLPMLEDKEPLVRLAAFRAVAAAGARQAQVPAIKALEDDDWRVRAEAIKALRKFRLKTAVQPLIDCLRRERGRLQDDATEALQDLCDKELTGDAEKWQEWWDRVKIDFKIPTLAEIEARKRKEKTAREREGYAAPPARRTGYPPYHGIRTRSRKILFVLDISASMANRVVLDKSDPRLLEEYKERYGDSDIKIDVARDELIDMVAGLERYAYFNIVLFNRDVDFFKKRLVKAHSGNKNKAIKWLDRLTPEFVMPRNGGENALKGETNTFDALNACFGFMSGMKFDKDTYKTEADTVFFLSDGLPSVGRITQPQELLDYFATVNERAGLVWHTIAFGLSNRYLMEGIANMSGGQSVIVGN